MAITELIIVADTMLCFYMVVAMRVIDEIIMQYSHHCVVTDRAINVKEVTSPRCPAAFYDHFSGPRRSTVIDGGVYRCVSA